MHVGISGRSDLLASHYAELRLDVPITGVPARWLFEALIRPSVLVFCVAFEGFEP